MNSKPEVYTASGSLQIKTVIIVLGLDWSLFEKMEGGCGVSDVISGLETSRWFTVRRGGRMGRERKTQRGKEG